MEIEKGPVDLFPTEPTEEVFTLPRSEPACTKYMPGAEPFRALLTRKKEHPLDVPLSCNQERETGLEVD